MPDSVSRYYRPVRASPMAASFRISKSQPGTQAPFSWRWIAAAISGLPSPAAMRLANSIPQTGNWSQWPLKKGSAPFDLVFDKQGNLWITEFGGNSIAYFNPQTRTLVETTTPTAGSNPYGITLDPSGNIWFAENANGLGQIASFTPTSNGIIKIKEYAVNAARPHLIRADKAGNIWYSDGFTGNLGEFDPRTGVSKNFLVYHLVCNPTSCTGTHISGICDRCEGRYLVYRFAQSTYWLPHSIKRAVRRTDPQNPKMPTPMMD